MRLLFLIHDDYSVLIMTSREIRGKISVFFENPYRGGPTLECVIFKITRISTY